MILILKINAISGPQLHAIDKLHLYVPIFIFTGKKIYSYLQLFSTSYCDFNCSGFCYLLFYCYIPFLLYRQNWGPRLDLHDPRFLALAAEHRLLQAEYDDYAAANSSGIACCRGVALIVSYPLPLRNNLFDNF